MNRVDLRALARKPRGRVVLRPIESRAGTINAYRRILRRIEATILAAVKRDILPRYEWTPPPGHTQDEAFAGWFEALEAELASLLAYATRAIRGLLDGEAKWTSEAFTSHVRSLMGVDLAGVIRAEDLQDYLDAAVARNVGLIKGLSDDGAKALRAAVAEAYIRGDSPERMQKLIRKRLGFMKARAELIAVDQIASVSSEVNEIRQRQVGVEEYIWETSRDERVRPRHRHLQGKTYKWGEPTGAEEGLPPGRPIRCRCVARAILDWGDGYKTKATEMTAEEKARWARSPDGRKIKSVAEPVQTSAKRRKPSSRGGVKSDPGLVSKRAEGLYGSGKGASKAERIPPAAPEAKPQPAPARKPKPAAATKPKRPPHEEVAAVRKLPADTPAKIDPIVTKRAARTQTEVAKLTSPLTSDEESYLDFYNGDGFLRVNKALREGRYDDVSGFADGMRSAIGKSRLQRDVPLYRGVKHKELHDAISEASVGGTIRLDGFQSTTTNADFARKWGGIFETKSGYVSTDDSVFFEIRGKSGQNALYSNLASEINKHEQHVILPDGMNYRVLEVGEMGKAKRVVLEIVDD